MKTLLLLTGLFLTNLTIAQSKMPEFLVGTWQSEDGKTFEHWDKLSKTCIKGYSYQLKKGQTVVTEYLEMCNRTDGLFYIPTVIGQNDGKPVEFKLTQSDSLIVFENAVHDFPKKIIYKKLNANTIQVKVLGENDKGFSYKMSKADGKPMKMETENSTSNPNYDKDLAEKLKGDDYGMKSYVFVILKTGENTTTDKKYIDSCFMGHMSNMNVLVEKGDLVVAGPFQKNDKTYRGLFILNVATIEEAKAILATDPAVNAKLLDYELYGWYGSAALSEYLEASDKIWRKQF